MKNKATKVNEKAPNNIVSFTPEYRKIAHELTEIRKIKGFRLRVATRKIGPDIFVYSSDEFTNESEPNNVIPGVFR